MPTNRSPKNLAERLSRTPSLGLVISILLSFGITTLFYLHEAEELEVKNQILFDKLVQNTNIAFEQYVHPLQGISTILHYSDFKFSSKSFRKSAESREMYSNFKGALGFGFIRYVKTNDIPNCPAFLLIGLLTRVFSG